MMEQNTFYLVIGQFSAHQLVCSSHASLFKIAPLPRATFQNRTVAKCDYLKSHRCQMLLFKIAPLPRATFQNRTVAKCDFSKLHRCHTRLFKSHRCHTRLFKSHRCHVRRDVGTVFILVPILRLVYLRLQRWRCNRLERFLKKTKIFLLSKRDRVLMALQFFSMLAL
jgi:hypothetical protein